VIVHGRLTLASVVANTTHADLLFATDLDSDVVRVKLNEAPVDLAFRYEWGDLIRTATVRVDAPGQALTLDGMRIRLCELPPRVALGACTYVYKLQNQKREMERRVSAWYSALHNTSGVERTVAIHQDPFDKKTVIPVTSVPFHVFQLNGWHRTTVTASTRFDEARPGMKPPDYTKMLGLTKCVREINAEWVVVNDVDEFVQDDIRPYIARAQPREQVHMYPVPSSETPTRQIKTILHTEGCKWYVHQHFGLSSNASCSTHVVRKLKKDWWAEMPLILSMLERSGASPPFLHLSRARLGDDVREVAAST
jgi:hypothetical protein